MCGIFGYLGTNHKASDLIIEGLKTLEYRGYDSWGVAIKSIDGSIHLEKHTGKIGDAHLPPLDATMGIGHTRWATHGGVTDLNAHPHTDCTGKIVIVHNGIVENYESLKQDLINKQHQFKSETDSEVIAHLIEEEIKKTSDTRDAILSVFNQLKGMSAVIVFFPEKEEFYIIKNGSPIVFGAHDKEYIVASDSIAIAPFTKEVYYLNDYELLEMTTSGYALYDMENQPKQIEFMKLPYDPVQAQLGKYAHYMIKEIYEQPDVIQDLLHEEITIKKLAELIKNSFGTYLIGCGTASYAALAGTYLFSKVAKFHVNFSTASEFTYCLDFLKDGSLVIPISQSGETIDVISSIQQAKKHSAKILAITNVIGSTLYRLSDHQIALHAGPEKAVCSTKAFTAQIAVLYLLAYALADNLPEGIRHLEKAILEILSVLKEEERIKALSEQIKDTQHIFILGRGISYATALESALKIKEVSYIHAEGFAAGELKHGVIALIEKGTPVIVYNPEDETYEDTLSSAHEVKARGAYIIGISSKPHRIYDEYIEVKNCGDATLIPNVVIAQLMGYYLALAKNLDPDKPRNLAKSVVVK
jgi:glucosamine--fructose-6-phosphate aminotransferase (isomerizing)